MIPKILHLYWGKNQPLSFLRSLTVTTFRKLNPDWDIRVWVPKYPSMETTWKTGEHPVNYHGRDFLPTLEGVREFDFQAIGISEKLPEVHKSDLLRWHLLGTQGGIWSDFDVLYVRPISNEMIASWRGAGLCRYEVVPNQTKEYQAIGFLTSEGKQGETFFSQLFEFGLAAGPQAAYQAFGAGLLEKFLASEWQGTETPFYLNPDVVYPMRHNNEFLYYFKDLVLDCKKPHTIGLHWYAGNPKCAVGEAGITSENYKNKAISICKEAVAVLHPGRIKYSFLMPYYKRSEQLDSTLASFVEYYGKRKDFEVIIANDIKNSLHRGEADNLLSVILKYQGSFPITVFESGTVSSWNPVSSFQKAAQIASGDFLIITNPECVHRADILNGLDQEFSKNQSAYVICGCFSIPEVRLTPGQALPAGQWYQHSQHRNVEIHFCSALHRDTYFAVGGFDVAYGRGMGFDDDDFRNRLKRAQVLFVPRDDLLTVHLAHPNNKPPNYPELHAINRAHYHQAWGREAPMAENQRLKEPSALDDDLPKTRLRKRGEEEEDEGKAPRHPPHDRMIRDAEIRKGG